MQQVKNHHKQKRVGRPDSFLSVNSIWCTVEYEHITFPDDLAADTQKIRDLLDSSINDKKEAPG